MTTDSRTVAPVQSTDAEFRAWGSAVSAAIAAVGLAPETFVTGQINWTTVAKPSGASNYPGFEVFRFPDSLQSSSPIFLKVEYGASSAAATTPSMRFSVSTVTSSAGTFNAQLGTQLGTLLTVSSAGNNASAGNLYTCYTDSTFVMSFFPGGMTASGTLGALCIERFRDSDGAVNGEGFTVVNMNSATASQIVAINPNFRSGTNPTMGTLSQITMANATMVEGSDIGFVPIIPFSPRPRPPMKGLLNYFNGDITRDTQPVVAMYGANRNYRAMGSWWPWSSATNVLAMLWE